MAVQTHAESLAQRIATPIGETSFSGADYTAVVFLPVTVKELEERRNVLTNQQTDLKNEIEAISDLWTDLSAQYSQELSRSTPNASTLANLVQQLRAVDIYRLQRLREILDANTRALKSLNDIGVSREEGKVYGFRPVTLGNLQTLSISSHRDKRPVRGLGRVYPKSYVRGPRTLAGSLIFTLINEYALAELVSSSMNFYNTGVGQKGTDSGYPEISTMLVDQLPPFDITIIGSSEYGDNSYAVLYGVELVNDGVTMSIQDLITECVMQFVARDYDPLRRLSDRVNLSKIQPGGNILTADNVLWQSRTTQERRDIRLNPFV